jgi:hypothetical protein
VAKKNGFIWLVHLSGSYIPTPTQTSTAWRLSANASQTSAIPEAPFSLPLTQQLDYGSCLCTPGPNHTQPWLSLAENNNSWSTTPWGCSGHQPVSSCSWKQWSASCWMSLCTSMTPCYTLPEEHLAHQDILLMTHSTWHKNQPAQNASSAEMKWDLG